MKFLAWKFDHQNICYIESRMSLALGVELAHRAETWVSMPAGQSLKNIH